MTSDTTQSVIPAVAPLGLEDSEPLEQPIEEEFRAGTMTLSWDPDDERVVIEVFPYTEAAVVSPEQLDEELDRSPSRTRCSWSASTPAAPGRS